MRHLGKLSILLAITSLFMMLGCSNGNSPIEPAIDDYSAITDITLDSDGTQTANRSMIAAYDAVIDPVAETFTITPVTRDAQYHFPLTQMYPNCLQITGYGFTPNFWADIKLVHPLPGSGIDAFDPRVIAILPTHWGAYFYYPNLGVYGNPKVLLEPDGYTKLHDDLAPEIFGNVNPFVAYFKDEGYRKWSSSGNTEETKRWNIDLDGFGGDLRFKLVVDVSTNYPNPSTPIVDNAPEPVSIETTVTEGLTQYGGTAELKATIHDWQGIQSVISLYVEAPELFVGLENLAYTSDGLNPHEYIYECMISNSLLAPAGRYNYLIAAKDESSGIYLYKEFALDVAYLPPDGNLMWAKESGGLGIDVGEGVATLSDDSVIVVGVFNDKVTFGKGEPNQTTLTSLGWGDIFIAKYSSDGNLQWVKQAGGYGYDIAIGVTTLSDDSVIVTGYYGYRDEDCYPAVFGYGEPNETVLDASGMSDIFVARYKSDGYLVWAVKAGGEDNERGCGVTTLSDDSIVVTGSFCATAVFGRGEANETILTSKGYDDIFVARYNLDGLLQWAKRAGGLTSAYSYELTRLYDNSFAITGRFTNKMTFAEGEPDEASITSAGDWDVFMARYNPDGNFLWARRVGGINREYCKAITSLSDKTLLLTGSFGLDAMFGEGEPNQTILSSVGEADMFMAYYDKEGMLIRVQQISSPKNVVPHSVVNLSDDSAVITGTYSDVVVFGEGELNETTLTPDGMYDIFIVRYYANGKLKWAKRAGGLREEMGNSITKLSDNSTAVAGYFDDWATFGSGEPNETILAPEGVRSIFVARFEP